MFSLQRFLSKGDKFFDLLTASTEEACESVAALLELIKAPHDQRALDKFVQRRKEDKRITEEITSLLCSSFVTPLEREDMETLSHALSRIPKTIKKFAERLQLSATNLLETKRRCVSRGSSSRRYSSGIWAVPALGR